ncbi:MAG: hypothetical protein A2W80_09505 [Candidatus Riflebacteria bacterium GWC2_50_8]|nr:MAG: hypothetical protein A2W80_09505 [Candidatus Riflebacteria bacterium GWC2_50_8]
MIFNRVLNLLVVFSLFLVCFAEVSFAQTPEDLALHVEQIMQCIKNNQIPMAKAQVARFYAPEHREFLKETFGDELGSAYSRDFQERVLSLANFVELMTKRFQQEVNGGYAYTKCFKIDKPADIPIWVERRQQIFLLQNMKKPVSLYEIMLYTSRDSDSCRPIANFVIIKGSFKLIGQPSGATCGLN